MQILFRLLQISFISLLLFQSCGDVDLKPKSKNESKPKLTLEQVSRFSYVAIQHKGPYQDYAELKEQFFDEIRKQRIIPTGSPFIVYYNNPENTSPNDLQWEIGIPIAEGTMIKEPLVLKDWIYEKVAKVKKEEATPVTQNIYPIIFEQVNEKSLTYQGPMAVRVLTNLEEDTSGIFKTEIWIPLASANSHLSE